MGRLVHTGLGSSSLVAHVPQYPPLPTQTALYPGTFNCGLPSGATGVPLFTVWDPVAVPGRNPMSGNS
jgi:hypothetical protein